MAATSQLTATLRLGLAQIDSKLGDVAANVDKACGLINDVRQRVDLLVFPELALTGYAVGQAAFTNWPCGSIVRCFNAWWTIPKESP